MEEPNLKYIKELSGDDAEFEQKFITILKDEFPVERETYSKHLELSEYKGAADIVHKLKHKFNILSMEDAYRFAVDYEEQLKVENKSLHPEFIIILDKVTNFLKTI